MNEVFEELKEMCVDCVCSTSLVHAIYDGRDSDMIESIRNDVHMFHDSPIWYSRMYWRNYRTFSYARNYEWLAYEDINEKVLYDISLVLELPLIEEQMLKIEYQTRKIMWRAMQQEKALLMYGKIPDDILNEILSFI